MESARRAAWTFSTIDHASSNEFSSNHYPVSISETLYLRLAVYLIRVLRQLYQRSNYPWFYVLLFHPYTFTVFSKVLPVAVAVCQRVFQYTNISIIIARLLPLLYLLHLHCILFRCLFSVIRVFQWTTTTALKPKRRVAIERVNSSTISKAYSPKRLTEHPESCFLLYSWSSTSSTGPTTPFSSQRSDIFKVMCFSALLERLCPTCTLLVFWLLSPS